MALNIDFDSPKVATGQVVHVEGTVPAGEKYIQAIQLDVYRTATTTHEYFSISKEYDNSAGGTDMTVDDDINMAIIPKLATGAQADTVTMTSYGSLEAQIVEA